MGDTLVMVSGIGAILFFIFLAIIGPHLTILALNTLFDLGLTHSLGNWAAVLWLGIVLKARGGDANKS